MTTEVTIYTYETALADAAVELQSEWEEVIKLPAKERADAIRTFTAKQSELAKSKVENDVKSKAAERTRLDDLGKAYKANVLTLFNPLWEANPALGTDLLALVKTDPTVTALTIQVTVHREDKDGTEVISLGSPVPMLHTRVPAKTKTASNGKTGGGRSESMTVNGTEYASAKAAVKAILEKDVQANRQSCRAMLEKAGHTVAPDA